jgi:hypothetical protein
MSVIVLARFAVPDVAASTTWVRANPSIPEEITAYAKSLGQLGHRILTEGDDLIVIDEWPDVETFNKFFESAPKMGEFLAGAGIIGEPTILVFDVLDVPGCFQTEVNAIP